MLYLYDRALTKDLNASFNHENSDNPVVGVISPEGATTLAAQMNNDEIKYPIVVFTRGDDIKIDHERYNFTMAKKGVPAGFDAKGNLIAMEKVIPIKLEYSLTVLTTNTADMDELIKELLFKYTEMYYLTITLPYEVKRRIRFGIRIKPEAEINYESGTYDYLSAGTLHQAIIPLECEGCVLVSYTPVHLKRFEPDIVTEQDL